MAIHTAADEDLEGAALALRAPSMEIAKRLRDFYGNHAFRSAEGSELLFAGNPFHHPLRPNDLSFVDFRRPVGADDCSQLSALMGQRGLLCIYEADAPLAVDRPLSSMAAADRESFYSDESRIRGQLLRPFLERHLFAWVDTAAAAVEGSPAVVLQRCLDPSVDSAARVCGAITGSSESARMAKMAAIQIGGALLSRELAISRWSAIDWDGKLGRLMATCSDLARSNLRDLAILARGCGLEGGPHTYWQFYLPTAIGVSNYLHRLTNDPRRIDQAIGAVLFDRLRFAKLATAWRNTLAAALELALPRDLFSHFTKAAMQNLHDQALDVLDARSKHEGEQVLRAAARGIAGMHRVWLAADEEFSLQCAWAERVDHFRLVARRYMDLIDAERMAVDLETYDEPSSERSTTHVHDTDRLLVIEYGEMDFWNSFGAPLHLIPGDMLYVPRHRLHGSVVTSERCVYHQPVINTALVQAYDSRWN